MMTKWNYHLILMKTKPCCLPSDTQLKSSYELTNIPMMLRLKYFPPEMLWRTRCSELLHQTLAEVSLILYLSSNLLPSRMLTSCGLCPRYRQGDQSVTYRVSWSVPESLRGGWTASLNGLNSLISNLKVSPYSRVIVGDASVSRVPSENLSCLSSMLQVNKCLLHLSSTVMSTKCLT